jgi:hypothetical protein
VVVTERYTATVAGWKFARDGAALLDFRALRRRA